MSTIMFLALTCTSAYSEVAVVSQTTLSPPPRSIDHLNLAWSDNSLATFARNVDEARSRSANVGLAQIKALRNLIKSPKNAANSAQIRSSLAQLDESESKLARLKLEVEQKIASCSACAPRDLNRIVALRADVEKNYLEILVANMQLRNR